MAKAAKVATNKIDSEEASISNSEDNSYQGPDITSGFTAPTDQSYAAPMYKSFSNWYPTNTTTASIGLQDKPPLIFWFHIR